MQSFDTQVDGGTVFPQNPFMMEKEYSFYGGEGYCLIFSVKPEEAWILKWLCSATEMVRIIVNFDGENMGLGGNAMKILLF